MGNLVTSLSLRFLIYKMGTIMAVNQDIVLLTDETKKAECLLMPVQKCGFFSPCFPVHNGDLSKKYAL